MRRSVEAVKFLGELTGYVLTIPIEFSENECLKSQKIPNWARGSLRFALPSIWPALSGGYFALNTSNFGVAAAVTGVTWGIEIASCVLAYGVMGTPLLRKQAKPS